MSELRPLSGVKLKSDFGVVRAAFDPQRTICDIGPSPIAARRGLILWAKFPTLGALVTEERVERRLAAVLAADVAGYSRLMGIDEEGTLARLKAVRKALVDPTIAKHRGRIVKTTGDGMLVEFASAVDAVRGAIEVQRGVAEQNASVPQEQRIEFRIGIHVGDIIIDDNDIFGDGVNVAARVENECEPGGVCVSGNAFEQIRGKTNFTFDDLGEKKLKNIERPMRLHAVRGATSAATTTTAAISTTSSDNEKPLPLPEKPSIAVLPFENMSGDPEQEYFADGMVEDIITELSRFKWLFVIARNSSFTFKGKAVDIKEVGRRLGVRYVLEGSVRKAAGKVRITGGFSFGACCKSRCTVPRPRGHPYSPRPRRAASQRAHPLIDKNAVYPMIPRRGFKMGSRSMVAKLERVALREAFMKILFAIVFAAISGVAFAQSPSCMPGGSCCINGTCGTLEQFKRNATIVCLQADAIENKSLPQSIELAGRCTAATIMAERVEGTQQANAREHQQALDAQRKLREMGAPLPPQAPQDPMVVAQNEMVAAITECRNKRISGMLKTFVASAQCANPRIIQAFSKASYRYMGLIAAFNDRRLRISERVDRNELTEADAQIETQKLFASIAEVEKQRDSVRK